MTNRTLFVLLAGSLLISTHVYAAGSSSSSIASSQGDNYSQAVKAVKSENFNRALRLFSKVVAKSPGNADAWNYIGFSHRKLMHYAESLAAYNKALAINPDHIGANEYLGELYVQTGKLAQARARLGKLKELCGTGCEEYQDLDRAIKKHQAG